MSLDPLPRGYDAWRTATPWDDETEHVKSCPMHPDREDEGAFECGGYGEHFCSYAHREINGCELVEMDCTCPSLEELKAEAAEARADARSDR